MPENARAPCANRARSPHNTVVPALGRFSHRFWAAAVGPSVPPLAEVSGALALAFFAFRMPLQFFLVLWPLRETHGVSL